jgi:hypothetical protein
MLIRSIDIASLGACLVLATAIFASGPAPAAAAKYELVAADTKMEDGHKLTRVRRLADGTLGGYIESENNLSQQGSSFLDEQSRAYGQAQILDDAQLHGLARGSAKLSGRGAVYGAIYGDAQVKDDAAVYGQVYGNAVVEGSAIVHGHVYGNARVKDHAQVYGNVFGDAVVGGSDTIYGNRN